MDHQLSEEINHLVVTQVVLVVMVALVLLQDLQLQELAVEVEPVDGYKEMEQAHLVDQGVVELVIQMQLEVVDQQILEVVVVELVLTQIPQELVEMVDLV